MAKIKARESQNIEYKSSWHDEYLKWICGFANAQGAVMYFGVNNDHVMPKVENFCGGVRVTIERTQFVRIVSGGNVTSDVTSDGSSFGSLSGVQLTERQKKICEMIKRNSRISVKEMSLVLSLVERTIKRDLAAMQKKGVLIREGNTSAGHWIVVQGVASVDEG